MLFRSISGYIKKSSYKSTEVVSFFNKPFYHLEGKSYREIRETKNKYNKTIIIKKDIEDIQEVVNFILNWNEERGKEKYGWFLHSGYDINFFERHWKEEKDNLWSSFFYIEDRLVGYSICSKERVNDCYNYIIRKNDISLRNLTLYIDYKTFERIWKETEEQEFYINWGCSSKTLLRYKKKFPVYSLKTKYFLKFTKE